MPYIKDDDRPVYDPLILELVKTFNANTLGASDGDVVNVGHLNYVFSQVLWLLFYQSPSYHHAVDIGLSVDAIKMEFYRRVIVPYENGKIAENGDLCVTMKEFEAKIKRRRKKS